MILGLEEFKEEIKRCHRNGYFKNDQHSMEVNFKLKDNSIDFIGFVMYDEDNENKTKAFCGIDIYPNANKEICGFIHCLGVTKEYRGQGLSKVALGKIIDIAKEKYKLYEIYSICNGISAKTHDALGFIRLTKGIITKTGKLSRISMKKVMR